MTQYLPEPCACHSHSLPSSAGTGTAGEAPPTPRSLSPVSGKRGLREGPPLSTWPTMEPRLGCSVLLPASLHLGFPKSPCGCPRPGSSRELGAQPPPQGLPQTAAVGGGWTGRPVVTVALVHRQLYRPEDWRTYSGQAASVRPSRTMPPASCTLDGLFLSLLFFFFLSWPPWPMEFPGQGLHLSHSGSFNLLCSCCDHQVP